MAIDEELIPDPHGFFTDLPLKTKLGSMTLRLPKKDDKGAAALLSKLELRERDMQLQI